jgi:phasin family protein
MARKAAPADVSPKSAKPKRRPAVRRKPAAKVAARAAPATASTAAMNKTLADMSRMANLMTPEQAIELYKANAKMALDVINTAIDNTAKLRRLQFEGEQSAREFGRKAARSAAEARDPQALMSMSAQAGQEALEKSLAYWGEMFDLIVEMQKRLFALIEEQAEGMPGVKQAKAAMQMMPDLGPMQNVVEAMQRMVGSGSGAFGSMQKLMSDMARMAQSSMPGMKR